MNASRFNLGRMLYGSGTGLLCTVMGGTGDTYNVEITNNLMEGMTVDAYAGTNLKEQKLRIMTIDRNAKTVKFDRAVELAESDTLYVQGSKNKEITGLGALFGTATELYGLKKSDYPFLKPYIKTSVGAIDDIVIQRAVDELENNSNSTVDFITCSADVKYAYQDYLGQYKRNVDIMELDGGYKTLSFNGIPLVYERFVLNGTMYLLNTKAFKLHQLCDWRFLETENGKILRQNQGKATYTATLVKYCDLMCDKPNGQAKLSGIKAA